MHKLLGTLAKHRILHYLTAGGIAFAAEYGSFLACYYAVDLKAVASNSASFLVGLGVSFTLNKFWVFGHRPHRNSHTAQAGGYIVVAIVNFGLTNLLIHAAVDTGMPAFIAKFGIMGLVACWNFLIFKHFIFRHGPPNDDAIQP